MTYPRLRPVGRRHAANTSNADPWDNPANFAAGAT
jgi:hypothetical protein